MFDFHTHTNVSDGNDKPEQVIARAVENGLSMLALTDHNLIHEDLPELQKACQNELRLVNGCEISTIYRPDEGRRVEVHVVALDFQNEILQPVVAQNYFDREPYVAEIIAKLQLCGIEVPSLEELQILYPQYKNIGRTRIAEYLVEKGYVENKEEAKYRYLGSAGERRAYVDALDYAHYMSLEEAVRAVIKAGGIPVLAHLFSYHLSDQECIELAETFRGLTDGDPAAMEVFYRRYNERQMEQLRRIADQTGLYYSVASDYHGKEGEDLMRSPSLDAKGKKQLISQLLKKRD